MSHRCLDKLLQSDQLSIKGYGYYTVCCDVTVEGGVREALFSDERYQLMWGKRTGFAKVATEARVVSIALSVSLDRYLIGCWRS